MEDIVLGYNAQRNLLYVVVIIVTIIVFFSFVLYFKNRKLNKTNEFLYKKNLEVLLSEEKERLLRQEYEKQIDELKKTDNKNDAEKELTEKYRNSNLGEDEKQELADKIVKVMETSEEVFSIDFSAESLSLLVEAKQRYVSQVIHEKYHCNFNSLLSQYRIKEACRRFNDIENYGNYTIEAIANSVGFKSRSNFTSIFKRVTGLTPSEYQDMAKHVDMNFGNMDNSLIGGIDLGRFLQ
ncbi:helix-turn-helix domain-containing protein [Prevotella sp. OH937_COT-195]|uniref:helix-turn-helix domain-containing protein n=1 Tax=Prevotella sp. OH937_COT-195 TaxID=2491051 RepID=UPI000F9C9A53|nr:AraC family transcriptional regulator [Prevotella sp. OH937_COT-195]RRD00977.1 helix-turn-helix domain-containing protein [Prevotella sp. OH937_COT-195]